MSERPSNSGTPTVRFQPTEYTCPLPDGTALFYRAWEKYNRVALYEASAIRNEAPDAFTHSLFDLIGMGTDGLRGRMRWSFRPAAIHSLG